MQKKNVAKKVQKSRASSIVPLGDRVLVKPFTADEAKGDNGKHYGIILPESVANEKSAQGRVLAVGNGRFIDGKRLPVQVKVGDKVIFSKYSYDEVELDGEELYMLKEDNILAIISK